MDVGSSPRTASVLDIARTVAHIVGPASVRRLAGVVVLSVVNALIEVVAALFVIALIQLVVDPAAADEGPIGTLRGWFPELRDDEFLMWFCGGVAVFYIGKNLLLIASVALQAREVNIAVVRVALDLYRSYLDAPYLEHMRRNSAELLRNITNSTDAVLRGALLAVIGLISDLFVVASLLAVLLATEPVVAPAAGGFLTLLLLVTYRALRRRLDALGRTAHVAVEENIHHIQQGLGAFREIRVFGREQPFHRAYELARTRLASAQWRFDAMSQMPRLAFETIFVVALVVIIVALTTRTAEESDVLPVLGLFAYAGFRLLPSANRIIGALTSLRFGSDALLALRAEIVALRSAHRPERPPRQDEGSGSEARAVPSGVIVFDSVTFRYPGRDALALDAVSFAVQPGEHVGIVGTTGAGKSTLLDVMLALLPPDSGSVVIAGERLTPEARHLRGQIGYVAQHPYLIDDSLRANIALGIEEDEIDHAAVARALDLAQLESFVASLSDGLDTHVGERGVRLSGGQRQRIAIARALYGRPTFVVLDEATSALDYETAADVTRSIEALSGRVTMVQVTHRVLSVRRCDRILFLKDGRVDAVGTFDDLSRSHADFQAIVRAGSDGD